ncbi:hypothetical protein C8Q77DRAFT_576934 [Trametes polyzona]|nr:hypothetical protein C8Q77DRAFT_576934 [Trametes polyzona]
MLRAESDHPSGGPRRKASSLVRVPSDAFYIVRTRPLFTASSVSADTLIAFFTVVFIFISGSFGLSCVCIREDYPGAAGCPSTAALPALRHGKHVRTGAAVSFTIPSCMHALTPTSCSHAHYLADLFSLSPECIREAGEQHSTMLTPFRKAFHGGSRPMFISQSVRHHVLIYSSSRLTFAHSLKLCAARVHARLAEGEEAAPLPRLQCWHRRRGRVPPVRRQPNSDDVLTLSSRNTKEANLVRDRPRQQRATGSDAGRASAPMARPSIRKAAHLGLLAHPAGERDAWVVADSSSLLS